MDTSNCAIVPPSSTITDETTAADESPTLKLDKLKSSPVHQSSSPSSSPGPKQANSSASLANKTHSAEASASSLSSPSNHEKSASGASGNASEIEVKPTSNNNKADASGTQQTSNNDKAAVKSLRESPLNAGGSSSKMNQARRYSSTAASPERHPGAGLRKLSIQPRTTQYEPHPLLQGHNEHGITALEELFADHSYSMASSLKLQPRGAFHEKSCLMERNAAGLTELEVYLLEKEREIIRNPMMKATSVDSTSSSNGRRGNLLRQQSMPEQPQRPRLEPRVLQFEQHALMAEKDHSGMSILDAFLAEKEQDIEGSDNSSITSKGKCSEKCTCKNANCPVCKGPAWKSSSSTSSATSHPPLIKKESSKETVIEPKATNKRVHFSESGEDEEGNQGEEGKEEEEQAENNSNGEDPNQPHSPTKQNNISAPSAGTENNIIASGGVVVVDNNKTRTVENKCKAKAKRKCVIS